MHKTVGLLIFGVLIAAGIWLLAALFPGTLSSQDNQIHLVSSLAILAYLSLALFSGRFKFSEAIQQFGAWGGLFLILIIGYSYRDDLARVKDRLMGQISPSYGRIDERGVVHFNLSEDGHFYVIGTIQGVKIRFMVDTGASRVVLTPEDAKRLGFMPETLIYNQQTSTANGLVWSAPIRLRQMKVGTVHLDNVRASVSGGELDTSLLGMSFLGQLESFEISNGRLTLRP